MNFGKYYMNNEDFDQFLKDKNIKSGFNNVPFNDRNYFDIGNGWLGLIKILIQEIIELGWDKMLFQCKQKFGGLRFYISGAAEEVHNKISQYQKLSFEICQVCGNSGLIRGDSYWIKTLCDDHYNESKK